MRWVQINTSRSLTVDAPRRPSAAGTFVVVSTNGSATQAVTVPTLDPVATTLTAPAALGASTLALTSVASVVIGRRYLLGGPEASGGEMITVKSVAALVVTLVRPLRAAQATGATFQGTRVSFAVAAAAVVTPVRNMRVEWTPAAADVDLALALPFDALRYAPVTYLTVEDLRDLDPLLAKRVSSGTWLPAVADRAWDVLLGHVMQKVDPGGVVGTVDLTLAHGYLTRALLAETMGKDPEAVAYLEDLRTRYTQERDSVLGALAYDQSQTGAARTGLAGRAHGIRILRG